ncbi:MAG: proline hydroxylase [Alphaproteobacteria bacterium]|nr:proline hydroxylase [Alphaproteobacteria bacterium]
MTALRKVAAVESGAAVRLQNADWVAVADALHARGYATLSSVLDPSKCQAVRELYERPALFRSRVVMARHGFGQGEYQYFSYPLSVEIDALRHDFYRPLAPVANIWAERLGSDRRYPAELDDYLARCHHQGQKRPTPLLLKYGPGDYNRQHQDLYGGEQFPLQAAVLLSAPGSDFAGGEFVLTETAPRRQTRAEVVPLTQGDVVIFAVNHRPVPSAKGFSRVAMRHGVSTVRVGLRMTLGIIFHDAA